MNSRLPVVIAIFSVLTALGFALYLNFEIVSDTIDKEPLREIQENSYYALERWLTKTGHPVRVEKRGSPATITQASQKVVMAQASTCTWEDSEEILLPWIKDGGFLIIYLSSWFDKDDYQLEPLTDFLSNMGITIKYREDDDEVINFEAPVFFGRNYFTVDKDKIPGWLSTVKDKYGNISLVQIEMGKGALTITASPAFMQNDYIDDEDSARLSWDLTGARAEEGAGVLFIRGKRPSKSFFGKIAERGNFPPLLLSVFILIIIGFWSVIPVFGPIFRERKTTARSLPARLHAEMRFYKKYKALDSYVRDYLSELKPKIKDDKNKIEEIKEIETSLRSGAKMEYRDIIRVLGKLQSQMERIWNT